MRVKNIVARRTFSIVKVLYLIFGMCIALPLLIVLTTEGGIREILIGSWEYFLLLFIVPVITFTTGLYHFFFTDDQYVVKIHAKCVALGEYIKKYNKLIELPRDHFVSYHVNQSFFGLKKEICIEFLVHNKLRKQKFNISMLSSREHNVLIEYLNDIVNENNTIQ